MAIRYSVIVLGLALTASGLSAPGWSVRATAQSAPSTDAGEQLTATALEQLVGRIALYPDDLLSVVLPAATQPLQIVEAQRFLGQYQANKSLKPPPAWDR